MLSLSVISLPPTRFAPSKETLQVLNGRQWIANYSGGKDSTAAVTWIEYLCRIGMVKVETPRLVMSDTGVEFPLLQAISHKLMQQLQASGWQCEVVKPRINDRLYCQIFGRGVTPTHPGNKKGMRWCTRSTKIDPMKRFSKSIGADVIQLSGVRWGESDLRDGKLSAKGCAAGGECGLPEPGDGVYGPIITWTTCKVIEWLSGESGAEVSATISDLIGTTRQLVDVYGVKEQQPMLFGVPPKTTSMRFGCVGCPAISNEKITQSKQGRANPQWQHVKRIYEVWQQLYKAKSRCIRHSSSHKHGYRLGPIKMEVRKRYFAEILDIQEKSGITLVTPEEIAFVHECWAKGVYPRGWSAADELTVEPETGLFKGVD